MEKEVEEGIGVDGAVFDGGVDARPLTLEHGREAEGWERGYRLSVGDEGIEGFGQGITSGCEVGVYGRKPLLGLDERPEVW